MRKTILSTDATMPVHPTLVDPRTDRPLVAIGLGKRGPIWPILGGSEPLGAPPAAPAAPAVPAAPPPVAPAISGGSPPATGDMPLGEPGKRALEAERAARAEEARLRKAAEDRLQELEDKDKSELERLQGVHATLQKDHTEKTSELLQLRTAVKHGIPDEHLHLLSATDEQTLAKQAESIKALMGAAPAGGATPPAFAPNPGQGAPPIAPPTATVSAGAAEYQAQHKKT